MQVSFQESKLVRQSKSRITGSAAGTEGEDETVGLKEVTNHVVNKDIHRFELLLAGRALGLAKMKASKQPTSPQASGACWCAIDDIRPAP